MKIMSQINLRDMLIQSKKDNRIVVAVGIHDFESAVMLDQVVRSLKATNEIPDHVAGIVPFISGYLVSASLGQPDMGIIDRSTVVDRLRQVHKAMPDYPVGVDVDTGFGNVSKSVRYTAEQLFAVLTNIYLQIEDQAGDKTCGHMGGAFGQGKDVMGPYKFASTKLLPLIEYAKEMVEPMIMARTDSLSVHGIEDALDRAKLYAAVGAELLFVESPESDEDLQRVGNEFADYDHVFNLANMIEGSPKTPYHTHGELLDREFDVALYCIGQAFAMHFGKEAGAKEYFKTIIKGEDPIQKGIVPADAFAQFNDHIGKNQAEKLNNKYANMEQELRQGHPMDFAP
ncbi:MAG: isocitrate lyase/PEP mutase family protein [Nanoarchaeota archaeon]